MRCHRLMVEGPKGWNKRRCGEKCDDGQNDDDAGAAAVPSLLGILLRGVVAVAFMRQGFLNAEQVFEELTNLDQGYHSPRTDSE